MKTTQKKRIIGYMEQYGSISPIEAFKDLGITKLATRISEMKRDGVKVVTDYEMSENRFGEKVTYARYSLAKE